jgi:hypothetical protein
MVKFEDSEYQALAMVATVSRQVGPVSAWA